MTWFPLFEFQDWRYQSYLIQPEAAETESRANASVSSKKWAEGAFYCGQALNTDDGEGYTLSGRLVFREGVELQVQVRGLKGSDDNPATFEATGTGTQGLTKGALYILFGWVFPTLPMPTSLASRPLIIKGAVRAVRGPDSNPLLELGGAPVGTVGYFEMVSLSDA